MGNGEIRDAALTGLTGAPAAGTDVIGAPGASPPAPPPSLPTPPAEARFTSVDGRFASLTATSARFGGVFGGNPVSDRVAIKFLGVGLGGRADGDDRVGPFNTIERGLEALGVLT